MRAIRARTGIAALVAVCLGLGGVPAAASADADALRERRWIRAEPPWWRRALALPERGVDLLAVPVRETLVWAEDVNLPERVQDVFYFDEERTSGWFPNFDFGGTIGSAAGFQLFDNDLFGNGETIRVSTLLSTETIGGDPTFEEGFVRFKLFLPEAGGGPVDLLVRAVAGADEDEDFYVHEAPDGSLLTGHEVGERDQTTYELDQARARVQANVHPTERTTFGLAFRPIFGDVERGEGGEPPIPTTIDGFGGPVTLLGGGPVLQWDARDHEGRPRDGWFLYAEGGAWTAVEGHPVRGGDYRYARYFVELQRFQPTFRADRTLVFRVALDRAEPIDGGRIPFWDEPVLDQDHLLRSFERNRFRDDGALVANVEYRWPIWDQWDAFLFVDEGQVFRRYRDLDLDRFEWSAGGGIRLYSQNGFLLRTQVAIGDEDQSLRFGLEQEF